MTSNISLIAAFSAGVVSFLSPCVLPLVPAYLSYLVSGGDDKNQQKALLWRAALFILGFSVIFILLGASATFLGKALSANRVTIREFSGLAMIFFGLHLLGILKIDWLYREKRLAYTPKTKGTALSAFFLGVVFAAGWTPCIGPILASILMYAGSAETVSQGILLLSIYSIGLGVPFFTSALLARSLRQRLQKLNQYLPYISKVSGALMIALGYLVFNNKLASLNAYFQFIQI